MVSNGVFSVACARNGFSEPGVLREIISALVLRLFSATILRIVNIFLYGSFGELSRVPDG